ncbi:MAG: hypothetical protein B6D64_00235 [Bacteroidetes bacterium 4484_276]|nr:MAG: hypothetical protein B6D64_00235 [Bacteroidetes bacterium 4484_276]
MDLVWVTKADYISDFKMELTFSNGIIGIVDFRDKFDLPIYKPLQNKDFFKTFKLNSWTIEWENGADYAPEFLYEQIKKQKATQANKVYA